MRLFACTDVFVATDVSARPWYSLLQMLFWQLLYLQLTFLWACRYFSACLACTIASASCLFWDLKILPLQILHLHLTFSITWRCSPVKLRIRNLLFQCFADAPIKILHLQAPRIHYRRYRHSISFVAIHFTTWANTLLTKKWYKKFERIWSERWRHLERKFLH